MTTGSDNKLLHYAPRVIAILGILFLSSFALDVFGEGYSAADLVVALFMHLIPSFVLIAVLILIFYMALAVPRFRENRINTKDLRYPDQRAKVVGVVL